MLDVLRISIPRVVSLHPANMCLFAIAQFGRVSNNCDVLNANDLFSSQETLLRNPSNKVQDSMLESINDCTGQTQTCRLFSQAMAGAKPVDSSSLVELEPKCAGTAVHASLWGLSSAIRR